MLSSSALDVPAARREMRRQARGLKRNAAQVNTHLARLHAALELPGSEPVQGALADLFVAFDQTQPVLKHAALELVKTRMADHVVRWFVAQIDAPAMARITPLATRWSVLATPSADISTRARRCSVDDSRLLAAQVVVAHAQGDQEAQQAFFHHCVTCHDNLAFMLARRALLRTGPTLPPDWDQVSLQLEQSMATS